MGNRYNLLKLLHTYKVVVPEIQRDYAQGRKGKEYIREAFLGQIRDALDSECALTLDFVYGNVNGNIFYPLDGQQRLTTLWLVAWYISFKAGMLSEDKKELENFSYSTRTSSREFCEALCEMDSTKAEGCESLTEHIVSQTWFYSEWLQDPTISAMLRTLGGEGGSKEDNIIGVFSKADRSRFERYRNRLRNDAVCFELMVIGSEKLPISDDLYIKMNARGKPLSDFENFKADLVAWVQQNAFGKSDYPKKIDNSWTDVFWNAAKSDLGEKFSGKIDESFFLFINRYVLNEICLQSKMSPAEFSVEKTTDDYLRERNAFDKLYGTGLGGSDSRITYEGFEIYKAYLSEDKLLTLDQILGKYTNNAKTIKESLVIQDFDEEFSSAGKKRYSFIPRYVETAGNEPVVVSKKQNERVYFLAVCLYLRNNDSFDEREYCRWMRVVRNLTENAAIDNVPRMVSCMRLLCSLSQQIKESGAGIYKGLINFKYGEQTDLYQPLSAQLQEEKEKAEKILNSEDLEDLIKSAEKYAFFNGTIRFLYRNSNDEIDWSIFSQKFQEAKKQLPDNNKVPAETLLRFLRQFERFSEIDYQYVFSRIGYHPRLKCWKREILCGNNPTIRTRVHAFLMKEKEPNHEKVYQDFLDNNELFLALANKVESHRFRCYRYSHDSTQWVIHKDYSQTDGVYLGPSRKSKCEQLRNLQEGGKIVVAENNEYLGGYYWGIHVAFEENVNTECLLKPHSTQSRPGLKSYKYRWDNSGGEERIYRVLDDGISSSYVVWDTEKSLEDCLNNWETQNATTPND